MSSTSDETPRFLRRPRPEAGTYNDGAGEGSLIDPCVAASLRSTNQTRQRMRHGEQVSHILLCALSSVPLVRLPAVVALPAFGTGSATPEKAFRRLSLMCAAGFLPPRTYPDPDKAPPAPADISGAAPATTAAGSGSPCNTSTRPRSWSNRERFLDNNSTMRSASAIFSSAIMDNICCACFIFSVGGGDDGLSLPVASKSVRRA